MHQEAEAGLRRLSPTEYVSMLKDIKARQAGYGCPCNGCRRDLTEADGLMLSSSLNNNLTGSVPLYLNYQPTDRKNLCQVCGDIIIHMAIIKTGGAS